MLTDRVTWRLPAFVYTNGRTLYHSLVPKPAVPGPDESDCAGTAALVTDSRRPTIPGPIQSVAEVLEPAVRSRPDHLALVGRHGRYTYAELDEQVGRAARVLHDLGVRAGHRVGVCLPNDVEAVIAFLAIARLGAVWVGVHRVLPVAEKAFMLGDSGASVFLAEPSAAEAVAAARGVLPALTEIVAVDPDDRAAGWHALIAATGAPLPTQEVDAFAPAAIAYTSGTTGTPKGVVHSQHNIIVPGAVLVSQGSFGPDEAHGVVHPLTILNQLVLMALVAFQAGAPCVVIDHHSAKTVAEWVEREKIATLSMVPTLFYDLLTDADVRPEALASITKPRSGGSYPSRQLRELFLARFGIRITSSYGLTEAPTIATREEPGDPYLEGCLGRALPQISVHIRDEDDGEVAVGGAGEICVGPATAGPWAGVYTPMLGYWALPEETRRALRGGVLHTGDVGRLDESGRLFLVDRKSSLIIRGGSNIYPAEIEQVLHSDPRVAECAVVARPDERLGEITVAFVQLRPGTSAEPGELTALCRERLAPYKVPDEIRFATTLPRGALGKIARATLTAEAAGGAAAPGDLPS
jgi:acyl-CoA synthetase (AMP-forming)/AMP-acid ligase II